MLEVHIYDAGYCTHSEKTALRTGRREKVLFPALFAHIKHPDQGDILFDTGYSEQFFLETKTYPARLYAKITPVTVRKEDLAVSKLAENGTAAEDVRWIIISHFHADHIGAARAFPNARFICLKKAYDAVRGRSPLASVGKGFLPGLLPDNFEERTLYAERLGSDPASPAVSRIFSRCYDLFGDSSLIGVELPGHAEGQLGLSVNSNQGRLFFAADSAWTSSAYEQCTMPAKTAYLTMNDSREYAETLAKLHQLSSEDPELIIVPSHCGKKYRQLAEISRLPNLKLCGTE